MQHLDYRKKCEQLSAAHYRRLEEKYKNSDTPWRAYFVTVAELPVYPNPKHGDTWGNWRFNAKTLALTYLPRNRDFDLENKNIFGLIFHFAAKTFMTAEDVGNLIFALSDLMYGAYANEAITQNALKNLRRRAA